MKTVMEVVQRRDRVLYEMDELLSKNNKEKFEIEKLERLDQELHSINKILKEIEII